MEIHIQGIPCRTFSPSLMFPQNVASIIRVLPVVEWLAKVILNWMNGKIGQNNYPLMMTLWLPVGLTSLLWKAVKILV